MHLLLAVIYFLFYSPTTILDKLVSSFITRRFSREIINFALCFFLKRSNKNCIKMDIRDTLVNFIKIVFVRFFVNRTLLGIRYLLK